MIGRNVEYEALPNPVRRHVERIRRIQIPFNRDPKPIMGWRIMMIGRNVEYEALPNPIRRHVERIRRIQNPFQS